MTAPPFPGARSPRGSARVVAALLVVIALLVVVALPGVASAHGVHVGQSDIRADGGTVRYDLAVTYDELAKRVDIDANRPGAPPVEATDGERRAALREGAAPVAAYVGEHVRLRADGLPCAVALDGTDVVAHRDEVFAVLSLSYACPIADAATYELDYTVLFDPLARAERTAHASMTTYDLAGETGRVVIEPAHRQLRVGDPPVLAVAVRGLGAGVARPVLAGGLVLALLALAVAARDRRERLATAAAGAAALVASAVAAAAGAVVVAPVAAGALVAVAVAGATAVAVPREMAARSRLAAAAASGLALGVALAGSVAGDLGDVAGWRLVATVVGAALGLAVAGGAVAVLGAPLLAPVRRRTTAGAGTPASRGA